MDDCPALFQMNLVVRDMSASVDFYRRLGLDVPDTTADFRAHHRSAKGSGGAALDMESQAFAAHGAKGANLGRVLAGFRVGARERVDAIEDDLPRAGHEGLVAPPNAFWGVRFAIVRDPDEYAVGLMSAHGMECRSDPGFPPQG